MIAQQVLIPANWPETFFTVAVVTCAIAVILLVLTIYVPLIWVLLREAFSPDDEPDNVVSLEQRRRDQRERIQ